MYQETQRESGQEKPNKSRRGGLWLLAVGLVVGVLIGTVFSDQVLRRSGSGGTALFDATGSYDLSFWLYVAGFAIASALFAAMSLALRSGGVRAAANRAGMGRAGR